MESLPLKIRRGRRQDFAAVMDLLAAAGVAVPPADRAALSRFRRVAADLGTDLYVAERNRQIVGVVYASYVRQLASAQRARIEQLAVHPSCGGQGVEAALVDFVAARARQRACVSVSCVPAVAGPAAGAAPTGLMARGTEYSLDLTPAEVVPRG